MPRFLVTVHYSTSHEKRLSVLAYDRGAAELRAASIASWWAGCGDIVSVKSEQEATDDLMEYAE